MANQCTKFEVPCLNCSRDILGGLKFEVGHVTWPRPFQGQSVIPGQIALTSELMTMG